MEEQQTTHRERHAALRKATARTLYTRSTDRSIRAFAAKIGRPVDSLTLDERTMIESCCEGMAYEVVEMLDGIVGRALAIGLDRGAMAGVE